MQYPLKLVSGDLSKISEYIICTLTSSLLWSNLLYVDGGDREQLWANWTNCSPWIAHIMASISILGICIGYYVYIYMCVRVIYYLQLTHCNLSFQNQQETLRYCASLYHGETKGVLLEQQVAGGWAYLSIHHHPSIRPSINVSTHLIVLHPYHVSIPLSYRFIYTPVHSCTYI